MWYCVYIYIYIYIYINTHTHAYICKYRISIARKRASGTAIFLSFCVAPFTTMSAGKTCVHCTHSVRLFLVYKLFCLMIRFFFSKDDMPKGYISIRRLSIELVKEDLEHGRWIINIVTPLRIMRLKCKHRVALEEWIRCICKWAALFNPWMRYFPPQPRLQNVYIHSTSYSFKGP